MTSSHPVGTAPADAQPEHPTPGAMSLLEALDVLAKSAGYVLDTSAMDFKHDEVRAALSRLEDLRAVIGAAMALVETDPAWWQIWEGSSDYGGTVCIGCGTYADWPAKRHAPTCPAVALTAAALGQGQQDANE